MVENSADWIETLKQAADGLLVMSESDYPIEISRWEKASLTVEELLQSQGISLEEPIETVELEAFFHPMTAEWEWRQGEELATARRFQDLVKLIRDRLTDVAVYRVGQIAIDVLIVGRASEAEWVILATKVVET